mmetsp:Transcript_3581/g.10987  ORF Transcript_3581/g.10987 Transcript_3581/m.10987 type:complete len:120 (-) Transcript_3581:1501-1860(-)
MAEAGEFPTDLCGCCSVKDCGAGCFCKLLFCYPCNYGGAIQAVELGPCCPCACAINTPCSCCVGAYNRHKLTEKYNIDQSCAVTVLAHCCCAPCAQIQDMNLILTKENMTWGCCGIESS